MGAQARLQARDGIEPDAAGCAARAVCLRGSSTLRVCCCICCCGGGVVRENYGWLLTRQHMGWAHAGDRTEDVRPANARPGLPGACRQGEKRPPHFRQHPRERNDFSLCLSRACLGKMFVLIYKWLKKTSLSDRFSMKAIALPRQARDKHREKRNGDLTRKDGVSRRICASRWSEAVQRAPSGRSI